MKGIGKKTNNMVTVSNPGQMVLITKVTMLRERNMELECLLGQIKAHMKDNFMKITLKGKEFINGLMAELMKETGKTTKWMDTEYLPGLMVGDMKVNMWMIKRMGMEPSHGQMEGSM